ncbi:Uncharacterised protein [Salmonella enterica subsp. enterica serovar Bovismorbificans]|nr:Uncharacterised protein [Salmonella enterica subsp. enterica serovar Bovismorbificans]
MVTSQRERRQIHHFQLFIQHFAVGQLIVHGRGRIFCRIGSEYAIHFGRFQYDIRFNFDPAQTGRRVGSEERVTRTCRQNHNTVITQQANRLGPTVVVAHAV